MVAVVTTLALGWGGPAGAAPPSNDPEVGRQYGLVDIKAPEAWAKGQGNGIKVAIVSSGIAKEHPDLTGKTDAGFDATGTDAVKDVEGRGTHLAGIVGAATNNATGIAGVAPEARLVSYKAFEDSGSITGETYFQALQKALTDKPQVLLVDVPDSFPAASRPLLRQWLHNLGGAGISVVVGSPKDVDLAGLQVVAVAATTQAGAKAPSTAGVGAAGVAAPGAAVLSTTAGGLLAPTNGYGEQTGTGQAAAHVAGAVAILRGVGASAPQAADLLRATARKGGDPAFGAGRIDAAAAVAAYKAPAPAPATTTTKKAAAKPPVTKGPGGGTVTIPKSAPGPANPVLPSDPVEPGEAEAVVPPGAEAFADAPPESGQTTLITEGDDRPLGALAVGFGLLFSVGTGLSVTLRRLADASA